MLMMVEAGGVVVVGFSAHEKLAMELRSIPADSAIFLMFMVGISDICIMVNLARRGVCLARPEFGLQEFPVTFLDLLGD